MFKSHEGLIESKSFTDFYRYLQTAKPKDFKCPNCNTEMVGKVFPTFDMRKNGRAEFYCLNTQCETNKYPIVIETIWEET